MYARQQTPFNALRWFMGLLVVIATVGIFAFYQAQQTNPTPVDNATAQPINTNSTTPPAVATLRTVPTNSPGQTVYRIVSEPAQMQAVINEVYFAQTDSWDLTFLQDRAGHLQGTSALGEKGNYVLAGHVELKDGRTGPFAFVHRLKPGDSIAVLSDNPDQPVVMRYKVTEIKRVKPDNFDAIRNHGHEELTLITCTDWDGKQYQSRIVVHAIPEAGFLDNKNK